MCIFATFLFSLLMNSGESSSKKGKRPVSDENTEIIASSDEEQITPNNKKIKLPKSVVDRLDKKVLKAWIMAGIPFNVIENPFVIDLFKDLNPGYSPPSRTTLSDRLVTEEHIRVV
uniref:Uncharacterized protein n=1 Tax=Rhizophagus irregularis (strain DAOM 181602 / DAOM 197198 / MUCL 43194) TaxID=747089 RepID=U9T1A5_RHIID